MMKDEGGRMKSLIGKREARAMQKMALGNRPSRLPNFILQPSTFILFIAALSLFVYVATNSVWAQTPQSRNGAHSGRARESFTAADRRLVERAIGATCTERLRDPLGSTPIDAMQSRPSLPVSHPDAVAGWRRAERLLPTTRKLVTNAIVRLANEYDVYGSAAMRARVNAANSRVEAGRPTLSAYCFALSHDGPPLAPACTYRDSGRKSWPAIL